jgi:hypothetical protein
MVNVVVGRRPPKYYRCRFAVVNPMRLILHNEHGNVSFNFEDIKGSIKSCLDSLVKDLLDIAVTVFLSDQHIERDENLARKISILIPVRNPKRWNAAKRRLVQIIAFLIQSEFDIHFVQGEKDVSKFTAYETRDSNDCVCLLSEGLDNAAGNWVMTF